MSLEDSVSTGGTGVVLIAVVVALAGAVALTGAATADADAYDNGPTVETDVPSPLWIGQELTITDIGDDGDYDGSVSIVEGIEDSADPEPVVTATAEDGTVTLETDTLENERLHYIRVHGDQDAAVHGTEFQALEEDFEATIDRETVSDRGTVTLTVDSERDEQYVNVTADGLDRDALETLFADADVVDYHDDADVATVAVTPGSYDLDVGALEDVPIGELELAVDVTDSTAGDAASVEITDEETYELTDVTDVPQGDVAFVTLEVQHSSTAAVVLSDPAGDHITGVELENVSDEEVTLVYNTHRADQPDGSAWLVHADSNAEIAERFQESRIEEGEPMPVFDWELAAGPELTGTTLEDEYSTAELSVTEREPPSGTTTASLPAAVADERPEIVDDDLVAETDAVAREDGLVVAVEEFAAEGYVTGFDDLESAGIVVEILDGDPGPIYDPESWNSTAAGELETTLLNADPASYDDALLVHVENAHDVLETGSYDVRLTIDERNRYVADGEENYTAETALEIVERELAWNDHYSLAPATDATVSGTTTVAPGSTIDVGAVVDDDAVADAEATVAADGTFATDLDLSGLAADDSIDLLASDDRVDDDAAAPTAERIGLTVAEPADSDEPPLALTVDYPAELAAANASAIELGVTNDGETDRTATVELELGDESWTEELTVGAGSTETYDVTVDGTELSAGDHEIRATAAVDDVEQDAYAGTVTVTAADDDADTDADGTPGFGIAVAVAALLGAALLARRRGN